MQYIETYVVTLSLTCDKRCTLAYNVSARGIHEPVER